MNWFCKHRQEFISETLRVFGRINRSHLMLKFGISSAQAALDFKQFNLDNPEAMTYDKKKRTYVASKS